MENNYLQLLFCPLFFFFFFCYLHLYISNQRGKQTNNSKKQTTKKHVFAPFSKNWLQTSFNNKAFYNENNSFVQGLTIKD